MACVWEALSAPSGLRAGMEALPLVGPLYTALSPFILHGCPVSSGLFSHLTDEEAEAPAGEIIFPQLDRQTPAREPEFRGLPAAAVVSRTRGECT